MSVDAVARIIEVADAVAAEINDKIASRRSDQTAISPARFTARHTYGADYTNTELSTLRVDVRFPTQGTEEESRGGSADTYDIEITVQQFGQSLKTDIEAIDLLVNLANRIGKLYPVTSTIGAYGNVVAGRVQCISNTRLVYAPDKLQQNRFFSLIALTFREFVDL